MSSVARSPLKIVRVAALVVAVGVGALACSRLSGGSNTESTNDAYVEADFTLVAPRIAGEISDVFVNDNQSVKAGQLLIRIDDRDFQAALMSAEADVAAAKASVAKYEAEIARQPA